MEISRLLHAPASDNQLQDSQERDKNSKSTKQKARPATRKRPWRPSLKQLRAKSQRDADNSLLLNLTLDVNDLRQQVHDCLVQKSIRETRLLVAKEQFHARSLLSVDGFFKVFRHGHPGTLTASENSFLTGLLDENIGVGGNVTGRLEFYEQWRRYKQLFSVRRIRTFSTKVITSDTGGCLIECVGEFEGRVTVAALQTVFPNSLQDDALVKQVLHRRFVCPTKTLISIGADGRLVQYDAFSDVFEAMSKLLDFNPHRLVTLMADAAISDGSMLPFVDDCINLDHDGEEEGNVGGVSPVSGTTSSRSSIDFILS
ncbi:hypothetical protein PC129_g4433 [Phytophthora cactorum]|uniref:Uncharacterized protein n=1 Tax=Phytophthora cactorum TaxID=29920 RepID=A0A329SXD4_9STRA|nr:hypothetical protein GQ600_8985 [Phytophthora cactorum]KAG2785052.1 hypothetical protein Pcac1_g5226 [Phytophthora cactorum]KAG2833401.1 hypothetical protein PC112_g6499 [Phytophthora cactorum]KAG2835851.1 hypothetical protein PC111_g5259 [Phytophthora cactorum]KAG2862009.1 hypothetical protein PC113_g6670 [Phytophthora cactorum]